MYMHNLCRNVWLILIELFKYIFMQVAIVSYIDVYTVAIPSKSEYGLSGSLVGLGRSKHHSAN